MARGEGAAARFKALCAALPAEVKREVARELQAQADQLVTAMKAAAPVESGTLRDSIRAEPAGELRIVVKAGGAATTKPVRKGATASYDYALGTEFGTRKEAAKPFFFPSYRGRKKAIRSGLGKAVRGAVRKLAPEGGR